MATFLEQVELATNNDFIQRVQQAAVKTAIAVMAEDDGAAGHAERCALAHQVLHNPQQSARTLVYGMVTGNIDAYASDSDLEWMMASIWNAYAGV